MNGALWLPGWGTTDAVFEPLRAALDARGLAFVPQYAFDWADCGSTQAWLAAVERAVAAARPAVLVGWSLGALLALHAASHRPDCVEALILFAPTPRFCRARRAEWSGWPELVLARMRARLAAEPETTLDDFYATCGLADAGRLAPAEAQAYAGALGAGLALLGEIDLRERLAAVTQPVLLFAAADDTVVPPAGAEWLTQQLPQAELAWLAGGHAALVRDADAAAEAIAGWRPSRTAG